MHFNQGSIYYGDYLKLDRLLDSQLPLSGKYGDECHDETLFIIVHQSYELWFKQLIHEFGSILKIFDKDYITDSELTVIYARLQRVIKIQGLLLGPLDVLETMTPMDFLEFRNLLIPASGFQSVQFRQVEVMMGLKTGQRTKVDREYFLGRLSERDKQKVLSAEENPSLCECVERWLSRLPFTSGEHFDFWSEFQDAVKKMLQGEEAIIQKNHATLDKKGLDFQLTKLKLTQDSFESLFDNGAYEKSRGKGERRLSQKATLNALFIMLYRDEPKLFLPFQLLTALMDIDSNFTTWRYRHSTMAHRMLGEKVGTGGTSGYEYLEYAAKNNRVYSDLFNLSSFIIPRSLLPILPKEVKTVVNPDHL